MIRAVGLLLLLSSLSLAQSLTTEEILKRVSDKYAHISECHIEAKVEEAQAVRGRSASVSLHRTFMKAAPNLYRAEVRVEDRDELEIANGESTWRVLPHYKVWSRQEVAMSSENDQDQPESETSFQSNLVLETERMLITRYIGLARVAKDAEAQGDTRLKWGGRKVDCYLLKIKFHNATHQLAIDKESFLIVRHKETHPGGADHPASESTTELEAFETEAPAADFAFTAPPEFKEVKDLTFKSEAVMSLVGERAADFSLPRADGTPFHLAENRGKVVMLDFWATWCPPCRAELPTISKLATKMAGKDVVILGVNDEKGDTGQRYLDDHHLHLATLVDADRKVHRTYRCRAIPTVIIIGRDGNVVAQYIGSRDEAELMAALKKAGI